MSIMLILVIVFALLFDYVNGRSDSANAVATVISTRVLTPLAAVVFAGLLNFAGALVSTKVAHTIGTGLVDPKMVTSAIILAAMISAASWVMTCTFIGLPVSGSHSMIGGLVGATVAIKGIEAIYGWGIFLKVLIPLMVSPLLGFIAGYFLLVGTYWVANRMRPPTVRRVFSALQICSSGFVAFTHGMNDAQKVMGIITLALFTGGMITDIVVPIWVMMLCAVMMGLGTIHGGWKVIKTLGMRLAHIRPIEGFAAETAAGAVLTAAAQLGMPVSTTHTITGSVTGVGTAYQIKSVKWAIGVKILSAWVMTLPVCAVLGALISLLINYFHQ